MNAYTQTRRSSSKYTRISSKTSPKSTYTFSQRKRSNWLSDLMLWIDQNNSFTFQVIGLAIITLAVLLSFQGLVQSGGLATSAVAQEQSVRILTNFESASKATKSNSRSNSQNSFIAPITPIQPTEDTSDEVSTNSTNSRSTSNQERDFPDNYIVVSGDSLYSIAQRFEISADKLIAANQLVAPYNLVPGQEIRFE